MGGICKFTQEELAELAAFDSEVDADDTLTQEEWEASQKRDWEASAQKARAAGKRVWNTDFRRAYYKSHREQYAQHKKNSLRRIAQRYGKFGAMIREERKRLGLSARAAAELCHVSQATWYRIEWGQTIIRWEMVQEVLPGIGPKPPDFPDETKRGKPMAIIDRSLGYAPAQKA